MSEENLNEKMIDFVRSKYGNDYAENMDLVKLLYAKHNIATCIADCVEGATAKLKLLIVKIYKPKIVKLCSKCGAKKCKDGCGEQDYVDKNSYSMQAGDRTGVLTIRIPPWVDLDMTEVKEDSIYAVTGVVGKYKDKYDLTVEDIKPIVVDKSEDAVVIAQQALQVRKGSMNKVKFEEFMKQEGFGDYIALVKEKLKLKEVGDQILIG